MSKRAPLIVTCSAIAPEGDGAPKWVQLFPAGEFTAVDGRKWKLSNAAAVIAASKLPAPIDYDHGAERPATESLNSRAAGWIEQLCAQGPNGEPGLWGRVEWTPDGAKAVAAKEYRFISPSFLHHAKTGEVGRLLRAGLTNTPALDQLPALASVQELEEGPATAQAAQDKKELSVDELLAKLRSALNLPDTATADDVVQSITSLRSGTSQLCVAAGVTTLDAAAVTAICAKIKTPGASADQQKQIDDLQKAVATLTARLAGNGASADVEKAIAAGKIQPAQKEWAISYATRDPEGYATFIKNQPAIVGTRVVLGDLPAGELTPEEKAICSRMSVSEADYKAEKTRTAQKGTV